MYNLEEARNKVLDDTGEKKRVKIRQVMSATQTLLNKKEYCIGHLANVEE